MAHNARVRAPGTWATLTSVSPSEFELFDGYTFSAINGDAGGTWAPADEIVIGGLGLSVTGPFFATDVQGLTMTDGGFLSFNDEALDSLAIRLGTRRFLEVRSAADINVLAGGAVNLLASSDLVCEGVLTVKNTGILNVEATSTFINAASLASTGPIVRTGALGRARTSGRTLSVTDTDTTAGVENDLIIMTVAGAVGIVLTLKVTTAPVPAEGERLTVRKEGIGAGGLVVRSEGLAGTVIQWVGANIGSCDLHYVGGRWRALAQPVNGVLGPGA